MAPVANGFPADSPFNSELPYDIEQLAIFGEATLDFSDRARLTAGLRYYDFDETRTITTGSLFANGDTGVVDTTSSDGFALRFILSYDLTESVTLNAQAAKGFRLGGVNDPLNVPICTAEDAAIFGGFQDYDDETLWNYEGSIKVARGGVTFNASGFYTDISGLQVTNEFGDGARDMGFEGQAVMAAFIDIGRAVQGDQPPEITRAQVAADGDVVRVHAALSRYLTGAGVFLT